MSERVLKEMMPHFFFVHLLLLHYYQYQLQLNYYLLRQHQLYHHRHHLRNHLQMSNQRRLHYTFLWVQDAYHRKLQKQLHHQWCSDHGHIAVISFGEEVHLEWWHQHYPGPGAITLDQVQNLIWKQGIRKFALFYIR